VCRMIAAVGSFEMAPLVEALRSMAANANPAYSHELSERGEALQHDCGWGAAFRQGGTLERRRSAASCLADPAFAGLTSIETDLVLLHARRTPDRDTIAVENSHPFFAERDGTTWAFCHNGAVNDLSQFEASGGARRAPTSSGPIDSELLFHHILRSLDRARPAESLADILLGVRDFTCLNCFLATGEDVFVHSRVSPDTTRPRYYALWVGRGDGFALASSEVVDLRGVTWERVPDSCAFRLSP